MLNVKEKALFLGWLASSLSIAFLGDDFGSYIFEKVTTDFTNTVNEMAQNEADKQREIIYNEGSYLTRSLIRGYMYIRLYEDNTVPDGVIYLDQTHLANRVLVPNLSEFKLCNYSGECIEQVELENVAIPKDITGSYAHRRGFINAAIASEKTIKRIETTTDDRFIKIRISFDL